MLDFFPSVCVCICVLLRTELRASILNYMPALFIFLIFKFETRSLEAMKLPMSLADLDLVVLRLWLPRMQEL